MALDHKPRNKNAGLFLTTFITPHGALFIVTVSFVRGNNGCSTELVPTNAVWLDVNFKSLTPETKYVQCLEAQPMITSLL